MVPKVKEKGAGWNKRVSKVRQRVSKMYQLIRIPKRHSRKKENKVFGCHLVDLRSQLGAYWILKGPQIDHFRRRSTYNYKNKSTGRRLEQIWFWMDFLCQNGRPWKAKTSISHYTCCNLRGFAGSWIAMTNASQKVIQNHLKSEPRALKGLIFLIWGRCRFSMLHYENQFT